MTKEALEIIKTSAEKLEKERNVIIPLNAPHKHRIVLEAYKGKAHVNDIADHPAILFTKQRVYQIINTYKI